MKGWLFFLFTCQLFSFELELKFSCSNFPLFLLGKIWHAKKQRCKLKLCCKVLYISYLSFGLNVCSLAHILILMSLDNLHTDVREWFCSIYRDGGKTEIVANSIIYNSNSATHCSGFGLPRVLLIIPEVQIILSESGKQAPTWPSKAAYLEVGGAGRQSVSPDSIDVWWLHQKPTARLEREWCFGLRRERNASMFSERQTVNGYKMVIKSCVTSWAVI